MRCGLLGEKLGHSYSPELHAFFGNYDYELFEVPPDQLGDFIRARDFQGLNVTIPYKTTMLAICDDLTEAAAAIGSVNTVVKQLDGSLLGDNTDAAGFEGMVWKSRMRILGRKCLVLGSGGASLSVQYVLRKLGAGEIVVISRTGEDNYTNLDRHRDASILVNTTPVGMYPNTAASPVDLREFPQCEGVLDLIYNPARTALLQQAEALGFLSGRAVYAGGTGPVRRPDFYGRGHPRHPHQGGLPRPEPPEGEPNPDRYARLWEEHRGAGAGPAPGPAVCGL
ncbi:MAG: shikimate dehydrogenase family protein [Evtepia gabavorous]